jgi:hypothetical protein
MNATFTPPTQQPPPFDTDAPLPLGTASLISSGLSYDGVNTVTVQVPGKYLVQYSIEFTFEGESSLIEINTEYGAGGASVVAEAFPVLFGRDEGSYITGTRDRILDLQQNDIVRLRAFIAEGSSLYPDSDGTTPAIIFTMTRVG